jgi:hypothetical protein
MSFSRLVMSLLILWVVSAVGQVFMVPLAWASGASDVLIDLPSRSIATSNMSRYGLVAIRCHIDNPVARPNEQLPASKSPAKPQRETHAIRLDRTHRLRTWSS